ALLSPEHRVLAERVDLRQEALFAVFSATTPYGGYSITINAIAVADAEIVVDVTLLQDAPAFPKIEAATLPYHLVTVDRSALPQKSDWRYRLVSGDRLLAAGSPSPR
ncbi:MAG: protease complex subunit PrcB family protein, partial [Thermoflexales bacterium]|nr:protease complex subunit PrcB family protein [Thermoflexales bacterium]